MAFSMARKSALLLAERKKSAAVLQGIWQDRRMSLLRRPHTHAAEPSIVIDPVVFVPSDPALRAQMRWQAIKRDWLSYTAIVLSAAIVVVALADLRMRWSRARSADPTALAQSH